MTEDPRGGESPWTIPNAISALRLLGLAPLLWAGHDGRRGLFLVILAALLISDWVDGKLATWLDQRTVLGARFDSAVDAVMYAAIAVCLWWLEGDVVRGELPWFLAAVGSWSVSGLVSLVRFGRMPSYHTLAAKASWLVVGAVTVFWVATGRGDAVPWALGMVVLTNLEAIAVGCVLREWRADVVSLLHALRARRRADGAGG